MEVQEDDFPKLVEKPVSDENEHPPDGIMK